MAKNTSILFGDHFEKYITGKFHPANTDQLVKLGERL